MRQDMRNEMILSRSESCSIQIEEMNKTAEKGIRGITFITSGIGLAMMLSPQIECLLEGKKLSRAKDLSPFMLVMAMIVILAGVIVTAFLNKKLREEYITAIGYCQTESLMLDYEKIYGSTVQGDVCLNYSDIKSANFISNVAINETRRVMVENNILTITDIVGNSFIFYSFTNCPELKRIIDMRITELRNS